LEEFEKPQDNQLIANKELKFSDKNQFKSETISLINKAGTQVQINQKIPKINFKTIPNPSNSNIIANHETECKNFLKK